MPDVASGHGRPVETLSRARRCWRGGRCGRPRSCLRRSCLQGRGSRAAAGPPGKSSCARPLHQPPRHLSTRAGSQPIPCLRPGRLARAGDLTTALPPPMSRRSSLRRHPRRLVWRPPHRQGRRRQRTRPRGCRRRRTRLICRHCCCCRRRRRRPARRAPAASWNCCRVTSAMSLPTRAALARRLPRQGRSRRCRVQRGCHCQSLRRAGTLCRTLLHLYGRAGQQGKLLQGSARRVHRARRGPAPLLPPTSRHLT